MAYEVHLKEFDGPLDLLLHLIERAELDIKDIFISEITAEYLSLMEELDELDMDTASEFLTMAATLVYIKSRSVLPRPPTSEDEEEDPEAALMRQLRDYKRFKEAGAGLEGMKEAMAEVYTRLPEEFILPPQEYSLSDATCEELFSAFREVMKRIATEEPEEYTHRVAADEYTVRERLTSIRKKLSEAKMLTFEELFTDDSSKLERIVTFMALLEMISRGEIILRQKTPFGRITLTAAALISSDGDIEYMDEQN